MIHKLRELLRINAFDSTVDREAVLMKPPEIIGREVEAGGDALFAEGFDQLARECPCRKKSEYYREADAGNWS